MNEKKKTGYIITEIKSLPKLKRFLDRAEKNKDYELIACLKQQISKIESGLVYGNISENRNISELSDLLKIAIKNKQENFERILSQRIISLQKNRK